ncbi:MAG: TraI domain-containing protein [Gammaproteobacteria bacterium]|nr:TraI domain-containing protein [Gammaproteobacteria bacterium]
MFDKINLSSQSGHTPEDYISGRVLPVLTAQDLLGSSRHKAYLERLRDLCDIGQEHFDALYIPLVNQFSEFVQLLPTQHNGALGGLLNEALARALGVLVQLRSTAEVKDPLIDYALYSAALLVDISKLVISHRVVFCDKTGKFEDFWRPFAASMLGQAKYYKIYAIAPTLQRIETAITPLLARQLLPEIGFKWLSHDLKVFAEWLDALAEDARSGSKLAQILTLFRQDDLQEILQRLQQAGFDVEQIIPSATEHAEAFLNWLRQGLENGDIKFNSKDADVHVLAEGLLIEDKLFKEFADRYKESVNMMVVKNQFRDLLGSPDKFGSDYDNEMQYVKHNDVEVVRSPSFLSGQAPQRTMHAGMAVRDLSMVFFNQVPGISPLIADIQTRSPAEHSLPTVKNTVAPPPTMPNKR